MVNTKGREALQGHMRALELSQGGLADLVGVKQPSVSAWLSGDSRPDTEQRDILALVLSIPREWWRTEEEQARIDQIAVAAKPDDTGTFHRCDCEKAKSGTEG